MRADVCVAQWRVAASAASPDAGSAEQGDV